MIRSNDGFEIPTDYEPLGPAFLHTTIDTLFDQAADRRPEHIAIEEPQHRWTYRELKQHVDRLAALLTRAGAANQDRPVALCLPTGAPVIAAMLGTLKAGGFYVIIEPHNPAERNAAILENCEAKWVITDAAHQAAVAAHFPADQILMWHEAATAVPPRKRACDPASLRAAIVYTSGSTGRPKGVVHSQAFILNWTRLYASDLHLAPSDRVSLLYSAAVAGSIRDIYAALITGATLLPSVPREHSFADLARRLRDGRVSIYHSVPSLFRQLITSQSAVTQFSDVRAVAFGGERVLAPDLSLVQERFPPNALVYTTIGCTEAGTFARLFLRSDTDPGSATIPLGVAPADCRILLFDDRDVPVANGETGEIIVESRYLADGYWRCPQESALKFSTAPQDPRRRRYRTGDLGRWNADGMLCHAGRCDRQFTLRGYRVEAGEIEAALLSLPGVTNVIIRTGMDGGEARIVAHLEGAGAAAVSTESLRARCRDLLPEHMIPVAFHAYKEFPRLANDKVDIERLSRADSPPTVGDGSSIDLHEAKTLRDVWQALFPDSDITAQSNFFNLGGDSLLAMRVMNRVTTVGGVHAPMSLLLRHPTLEAFEKAVEAWDRGQADAGDNTPVGASPEAQESGGAASIALSYAQTHVQLNEQLSELGYSAGQLEQVAAANDLAQRLFCALSRPGGKPFVAHLIGTASILARHGAAFVVVLASLLHAAYSFGEFGSSLRGITLEKRRRVRSVVGEEAEELVYRYTRFPWHAAAIESLPRRLPAMSPLECNLVFMRLANELEEGADLSLLNWAAETRLLKAHYQCLSVNLAAALGRADLAAELEASHHRNALDHIP